MPESVDSLRRQAMLSQARGDYERAALGFRRLVDQHPHEPDDWYNLAWVLRRLGHFEEALNAYDEALARGVAQPEEVHLNRAAILSSDLNRDDEARAALLSALDCNAAYSPARLNLGNLLEEAGQRDEALACYRRLQEDLPVSDPIRLEALARIAHLDPPEEADDPRLQALEAATDHADKDPVAKTNLYLALARSYDRLGLHDQAIAAMRSGKQATTGQAPGYQPARQEHVVDALIKSFPASSAPLAGSAADTVGPVFVLGMYRSGSTLVEQVLGAHSRVISGGELDLLPRLVMQHLQPFPQAAANLDAKVAARLADAYHKGLHQHLPDLDSGQIVTDKRPPNFLFIGLIRRLFPDARVIHTVRNPLDTALSIYMHHLDPRMAPYACALDSIGHYYLQYRRLMSHWQAAFPGLIHEVRYDELVADPEPVIRSMLEFLELDWEKACLDFHRSRSAVRTASYWQVRQPLYKSASGRWRHYENHLRALRQQLIDGGVPEAELAVGG
ncbi:tetratricopeptide repeat protein [Wenzhouxiangella sp. XN201]|uniref:tetratricopeptide repeat-containing sulfotransferase family protein n=1 Tax=Wenzhouxiangella sp. XN201 TaxID=2710755 RepID=UPI0013C7D404|nr:sulfotransferase [Wenzhouxiangella sp. XN201]NEZ02757.1 tetratricopeptide repeat protein [Wenzhouxiangella sp. XN201]